MTATFLQPVTGFVDKTFVITEFEVLKLRHDFTELVTQALQPALWMLIFGQVFARSGAMHTGNIPYLDFIAPGILAQSVLFVAIFYGINVIWGRDLEIVQKFLVSPAPRGAFVLGKAFSAGIRSLSQGLIIYGLSLILGVKLNWSPLALLHVDYSGGPTECDECPVAGADAVPIGVFFCGCHSRGCAAGRIHRGDGQCERAGSFGPLRLTDGKKEDTRRHRFSLLGNVLLDRGFDPWKLGGRKESGRCPEERADAGCYAHRQGTPERDSQGAS